MILSLLMLTPGQPVRFETLTEAMWPDRPFDEARNSLRVHVSNLRKWLRFTSGSDDASTAVQTLHNAYFLDIDLSDVDWSSFADQVTEGQMALANSDPARAVALLRSALDMWIEPFPELIDVGVADGRRTQLRSQRELAEDELIEAQLRFETNTNLAGVIDTLEKRVTTHPYREHAHRQLIQALYVAGRRPDALDVYQRLERRLGDDLGIEPGPQLRSTNAAVLADDLVLDQRAAVAAPLHLTAAGTADPVSAIDRFVGRDAEVTRLSTLLKHPGFAVVWGVAGSGKTGLVHEVRRRVTSGRPASRWIDCVAPRHQSMPSLWLIRHALGLTSDVTLGDIHQLNSEILHELKRVPGTVLCIDDFQWVDDATIDFVRHAARSGDAGITILIALRTATVDGTAAARRLASTLAERPDAMALSIEPLDLAAVTDLIARLGSTLDPGAVWEQSGGNALFVNELIRSNSATSSASDVPEGVSALVRDRLEDASDTTARILSFAALLGQAIETDLLIRVAAAPVDDIIAALDTGQALGIVATDDQGCLYFTHALIVDSLVALLPSLEQCKLHDEIATVLDRRLAAGPDGPERATHHAFGALPLGDPARAVRLARLSGFASNRRLAFADARTRFSDALRSLDLLPDDDAEALRPGLLCELGSASVLAGFAEVGHADLKQAIKLAAERGDRDLVIAATAGLTFGPSPLSIDGSDETVSLVEQGVAATTGDRTLERTVMLVWLAGVRYFTHPFEHCRELIDEALMIADAIDDPGAGADARFGEWVSLLGPDHVAQRKQVAAEAHRLATRAGRLDQAIHSQMMATSTALELGELDEGRALITAAKTRLGGAQAPRLEWAIRGFDVLFAIAAGDLDAAEELAGALVSSDSDDQGGHPHQAGHGGNTLQAYGAHLVNIRLLQGRGAEAAAIIEVATGSDPQQLAYRATWVAALTQADDPRSSALLADLLQRIEDARDDVLIVPASAMAAEAAAITTHRGEPIDTDAAERLAKRIEPFTHLHAHINTFGTGGFYWGSMLHASAQAHASAGDVATAAATFRRAIAEHRRVHAPCFEQRSESALVQLAGRDPVTSSRPVNQPS